MTKEHSFKIKEEFIGRTVDENTTPWNSDHKFNVHLQPSLKFYLLCELPWMKVDKVFGMAESLNEENRTMYPATTILILKLLPLYQAPKFRRSKIWPGSLIISTSNVGAKFWTSRLELKCSLSWETWKTGWMPTSGSKTQLVSTLPHHEQQSLTKSQAVSPSNSRPTSNRSWNFVEIASILC